MFWLYLLPAYIVTVYCLLTLLFGAKSWSDVKVCVMGIMLGWVPFVNCALLGYLIIQHTANS